MSPKALTQRTGVQTSFPGCLKSLLQLRSLAAGNPESWLLLHVCNQGTDSRPMHVCQGQVGTGGSARSMPAFGRENTHHAPSSAPWCSPAQPSCQRKKSQPGKALHTPTTRSTTRVAALSDAVAGLHTRGPTLRKNALGFNSHQASEVIIPKY